MNFFGSGFTILMYAWQLQEDLGADRAEAILTRDRGRDFDRSEVDRVEANRLSNIPGTAEWQEAQRNAPLLNAWAGEFTTVNIRKLCFDLHQH